MKRIVLYLSLLLGILLSGVPTSLSAQERGVPSATVAAAWAPVKVDHWLGIRGGYGMATTRMEPDRDTEFLKGLFIFGLTYKFDVPKQKYVGMIEVDINYSQKGYVLHQTYGSDEMQERKYNVIEIPILWQPYLPLGKSGTRFHLSAGPFVSYAFNSTYREYNDATGETYVDEKYDYDSSRDNRWEYGVTIGGGFLIVIKKRWGISLDARYNIGLSDILKDKQKYEGNPFRSPVDQIAISLGVSYKIRTAKE